MYNSGTEKDKTTGYYETEFRRYDAHIGRFTGIDALAESYGSITPYQYALNNPVMYSDPTGLKVDRDPSQPGFHLTGEYQGLYDMMYGYASAFDYSEGNISYNGGGGYFKTTKNTDKKWRPIGTYCYHEDCDPYKKKLRKPREIYELIGIGVSETTTWVSFDTENGYNPAPSTNPRGGAGIQFDKTWDNYPEEKALIEKVIATDAFKEYIKPIKNELGFIKLLVGLTGDGAAATTTSFWRASSIYYIQYQYLERKKSC